MRRLTVATAALLAALLVQVTVLNGLHLPGGSPPDLVLVVVVVLAVLYGPLAGAVAGFAAGLAADIAPPASHLLGLGALVFCLAGYGCGRLRGVLERSEWLPLAGVTLGVAAGEALYALTGITFGDPGITWQSVRQVLPPRVAYGILLGPFVLWAVLRLSGYRPEVPAGAAGLLSGRELAAAGAGALAGAAAGSAVRDTGSGRGPRLRAGTAPGRWTGDQRPGGSRPGGAGGWGGRTPRLRLSGGVAGSAIARPAAPARLLPAIGLRLGRGRRHDGLIGGPSGPSGLAGSPARPGGGGRGRRFRRVTFSGSSPALGPAGQAQRPRPARLRLGGRRRGDGLVGGGALGRGSLGSATRRAAAPGRGTFRTGAFGNGIGGGRGAGRFLAGRKRGYAAPRFRRAGGGRLRRLLGRAGRRPASWRIGG